MIKQKLSVGDRVIVRGKDWIREDHPVSWQYRGRRGVVIKVEDHKGGSNYA